VGKIGYWKDLRSVLGEWDAFASWTHRVVHIGWQAVTADGATDREQLEKALKPRREFFEKRISMYSQEWLSTIDRAIELRRTVSASHATNASGEIEKQAASIVSAKPEAPKGKSVAVTHLVLGVISGR
jgi:hypothetical protein